MTLFYDMRDGDDVHEDLLFFTKIPPLKTL